MLFSDKEREKFAPCFLRGMTGRLIKEFSEIREYSANANTISSKFLKFPNFSKFSKLPKFPNPSHHFGGAGIPLKKTELYSSVLYI